MSQKAREKDHRSAPNSVRSAIVAVAVAALMLSVLAGPAIAHFHEDSYGPGGAWEWCQIVGNHDHDSGEVWINSISLKLWPDEDCDAVQAKIVWKVDGQTTSKTGTSWVYYAVTANMSTGWDVFWYSQHKAYVFGNWLFEGNLNH